MVASCRTTLNIYGCPSHTGIFAITAQHGIRGLEGPDWSECDRNWSTLSGDRGCSRSDRPVGPWPSGVKCFRIEPHVAGKSDSEQTDQVTSCVLRLRSSRPVSALPVQNYKSHARKLSGGRECRSTEASKEANGRSMLNSGCLYLTAHDIMRQSWRKDSTSLSPWRIKPQHTTRASGAPQRAIDH